VFYYLDDAQVLRPLASHAGSPGISTADSPSFRLGEGLVGQAALQDQIVTIDEPPADYLRVRSGLGDGRPRTIVLLPLLHLGKVSGVVELAVFSSWTDEQQELLVSIRETLAISLAVAQA